MRGGAYSFFSRAVDSSEFAAHYSILRPEDELTVYLRSDLWVKSCIHQAESRTTHPGFFTHLRARFDFARGVQIGATAAIIYAIATALLLIPYVVVSLSGRYIDLCGSQRIRQLFVVTSGRLQGACIATAVALVSIVALGFSARVRGYLNARLEKQWANEQQRLLTGFQQRCQQVTTCREASVLADEIYRLKGPSSPSYFDSLVEEIAGSVSKYTKEFSLGTDVNGKYERYESALLKIDGVIRTESRKLWQLPLTYPEVGTWRVREAGKLHSQTLGFLDRTADAEQRRRCATHAKKFNHKAYRKGVAVFRGEVKSELDAKLGELKSQRQLVAQIWSQQVSALRGRQRFLQVQAAIVQWVLTYFSAVILCSTVLSLKKRQASVVSELGSVNARRAAGVAYIATGAFPTMNRCFSNLEVTVKGLVEEEGKIQTTIEMLARPALKARLWRWLSPLLAWFPRIQKKLEQWLDPDVN